MNSQSLESFQFERLLDANRRKQAEIKTQIGRIDAEIDKIRDYKKRLSNPPEQAEDAPLQRANIVKQFVKKRVHPRLFFPPFFKYQNTLPPPNEDVDIPRANYYRAIKEFQLSQKPLIFYGSEQEVLKRVIFLTILADNPALEVQLKSLFYRPQDLIMPYKEEALLFLLTTYGNIPATWDDDQWALIAKSFPHRSGQECKHRFLNYDNPLLNTRPLTRQELKTFPAAVNAISPPQLRDWRLVSQQYDPQRPPTFLFKLWKTKVLGPKVRKWTPEETQQLFTLVDKLGPEWTEISTYFSARSNSHVLLQYKTVDPKFKRGKWTPPEDDILKAAVNLFKNSHPESKSIKWTLISEFVGTRNDTQCRNRYEDHLDEQWDRGALTREEQDLLFEIIEKYFETGMVGDIDANNITSVTRKRGESGPPPVPWTIISSVFFPRRQDCWLRVMYYKCLNAKKKAEKKKERGEDVGVDEEGFVIVPRRKGKEPAKRSVTVEPEEETDHGSSSRSGPQNAENLNNDAIVGSSVLIDEVDEDQGISGEEASGVAKTVEEQAPEVSKSMRSGSQRKPAKVEKEKDAPDKDLSIEDLPFTAPNHVLRRSGRSKRSALHQAEHPLSNVNKRPKNRK